MTTIELKYNNKSDVIFIPETWNELSRKQLLYIAEYWEAWKLLAQNNQSLIRAKALLFVELMCGNTLSNKRKRIELLAQLQNEEYDLMANLAILKL